MTQAILVTGGAGFIGSNYVRYILGRDPSAVVVTLDALTYAGNLDNFAGLPAEQAERHHVIQADICDGQRAKQILGDYRIGTIIHFAAESHVDRSIDDPLAFVRTNVYGAAALLHAARVVWGHRTDVRFHHVSTDEVYGSLGDSGLFLESTPYAPSSPYSASKAGADHLVRAWGRTYGLPITITNCSNNYGPYQFPEKLIPLMITNALDGKPLPVYGRGLNVRDWLYVEDHCKAIERVVSAGKPGETYNVSGRNEMRNIDIVNAVCDALDQIRPDPAGGRRRLIQFVQDRPGHDWRYAVDSSKIESELGWRPQETFETGLRKTLSWYLDHPAWIENIRKGKYRGERLGIVPGGGVSG